jgi:hypothetical protein
LFVKILCVIARFTASFIVKIQPEAISLMALVQFGGNEELTEESPLKNTLKKSVGKALQ